VALYERLAQVYRVSPDIGTDMLKLLTLMESGKQDEETAKAYAQKYLTDMSVLKAAALRILFNELLANNITLKNLEANQISEMISRYAKQDNLPVLVKDMITELKTIDDKFQEDKRVFKALPGGMIEVTQKKLIRLRRRGVQILVDVLERLAGTPFEFIIGEPFKSITGGIVDKSLYGIFAEDLESKHISIPSLITAIQELMGIRREDDSMLPKLRGIDKLFQAT
jgi:hypothetical protein